MSNCGFWSASGELIAVHGPGAVQPRGSFGPWARDQGVPDGRLVDVSAAVPLPEAPGPGWHLLGGPRGPKNTHTPRVMAPVAVATPALDQAAPWLLPPVSNHDAFSVKAWATWVATPQFDRGEGPEGWLAAVTPGDKTSQFLVRLVPHRGRLPGDGWRNMLVWALQKAHGVRLVGLTALPAPEALEAAPAWEYRVEAGRGAESAAWDVQILPGRRLLQTWAPGTRDLWEATALLRWVRPGAPAPADLPRPPGDLRWADLVARLPVADARLLVQNVLTTLPGGAAEASVLFFDDVLLPPDASGRTLVRHVPQEGLPLSLVSTLFGPAAWAEVDRAKRFLPPVGVRQARRAEVFADLDLRLAEGRLGWSAAALDLWQVLYRAPLHQALEAELARWRQNAAWVEVMSGDPRVPETLLRSLDVTDVALVLRDAPDERWRRFVTARREEEIRAEAEFCRVWEARGELTVERQIDAWLSWDGLWRRLTLDEPGSPT